jgi:Na+-transporting methylmalonyl-CoA/oxaloacetate decarboxylase gamma subunit
MQGLSIMVMGLSITFLALGLFIGVILVLERFFPPKASAEEVQEEIEERPASSSMDRDTTAEEIAAAIAIALAHLYSYELCRSDLGISLESGRGPWWTAGRSGQFPLGSLSIQRRN